MHLELTRQFMVHFAIVFLRNATLKFRASTPEKSNQLSARCWLYEGVMQPALGPGVTLALMRKKDANSMAKFRKDLIKLLQACRRCCYVIKKKFPPIIAPENSTPRDSIRAANRCLIDELKNRFTGRSKATEVYRLACTVMMMEFVLKYFYTVHCHQ
jgi:hypothetical protein